MFYERKRVEDPVHNLVHANRSADGNGKAGVTLHSLDATATATCCCCCCLDSFLGIT